VRGLSSGGRARPGLVEKLALVAADGVTPIADQAALAYGHTVREGLAAGATTGIIAPPDAPADAMVRVTLRLGPAVLGRGYLEAVDDARSCGSRPSRRRAPTASAASPRAPRSPRSPTPTPSFSAYHEGDR